MVEFTGLLALGLFVALIVGMFNPGKVLFWMRRPTRLKVFGLYVLCTFTAFLILGFLLDPFEEELVVPYVEEQQPSEEQD